MDGVEPKLERGAGLFERGADSRVQVVAAPLTGICALRLDAEPLTFALTFRALVALSKANIEQVLEASFVVRKLAEELGGSEGLRHTPLYATFCYVWQGDTPPNKGTVEIALMDRGIGIKQGLSNNPHLALGNDYEAILKSLVPGISGRSFHGMPDEQRTEWSNSGYGLFMTSQICRMGGRFNIGSGDSLVSITKSEKTVIDFGFEGTFIGMELHVKNLGKLNPLLHRLRGRGERVAKTVKVQADVEASYASSFVMDEDGQ